MGGVTLVFSPSLDGLSEGNPILIGSFVVAHHPVLRPPRRRPLRAGHPAGASRVPESAPQLNIRCALGRTNLRSPAATSPRPTAGPEMTPAFRRRGCAGPRGPSDTGSCCLIASGSGWCPSAGFEPATIALRDRCDPPDDCDSVVRQWFSVVECCVILAGSGSTGAARVLHRCGVRCEGVMRTNRDGSRPVVTPRSH